MAQGTGTSCMRWKWWRWKGDNYVVATGTYREDIILKWPQNRCERIWNITFPPDLPHTLYLESQFPPCQYPGSVSGPYQLQSKTAASGHACTIKMHADTCTNARTHTHSDRDGWTHSSIVYLHVLDSHPILHFEAQCITWVHTDSHRLLCCKCLQTSAQTVYIHQYHKSSN